MLLQIYLYCLYYMCIYWFICFMNQLKFDLNNPWWMRMKMTFVYANVSSSTNDDVQNVKYGHGPRQYGPMPRPTWGKHDQTPMPNHDMEIYGLLKWEKLTSPDLEGLNPPSTTFEDFLTLLPLWKVKVCHLKDCSKAVFYPSISHRLAPPSPSPGWSMFHLNMFSKIPRFSGL